MYPVSPRERPEGREKCLNSGTTSDLSSKLKAFFFLLRFDSNNKTFPRLDFTSFLRKTNQMFSVSFFFCSLRKEPYRSWVLHYFDRRRSEYGQGAGGEVWMWRFRSCHARALKGVEQRHRMHREPRFRPCRCANEVKVERTDVYVHRVIRSSCHKPHEPAGTARGMHAHTFKLRLGALEAVSASSNVHPNQSGTPAETCCRVYAYLCRGVEEALRARAARLARKRFFSRVLARFLARRR